MGNQQSAEAETQLNKKERRVDLKLITGGKEPPTGFDDKTNWLDRMEIGSCFLVKDIRNSQEFVLGLFRIASRSEKATVLQSPNVSESVYVDSGAFCNKYRCFEDLGVMITPEQEKETSDDERDREPELAPHDPTAPVEQPA